MLTTRENIEITNTTSLKVILPFYVYAAFSYFVATALLFFATPAFSEHYFHPQILAITHIMALGWGTMIILGASHQVVPVLINAKLYSHKLASSSFILAAVGIPLLSYGFYVFDMGWPAKWGGRLVVVSIICYVINLAKSMQKSKKENLHAVFVFTATIWLLATSFIGLALVYNFTYPLMPKESLDYLPLHAHTGVVGWFLLLVIGVGSRLIPLFISSTYKNDRLLWWIYGLINGGLLSFVFIFLSIDEKAFTLFPIVAIICAVLLFGYYCVQSFRNRFDKKIDEQSKFSLLSVCMMILPIFFLVFIMAALLLSPVQDTQLVLSYGFVIFFGWITAIILAMTFKTLPAIVWNKFNHNQKGIGHLLSPKEMFSNRIFIMMCAGYIAGFLLFTLGILSNKQFLLQSSAILLLVSAFLYNWNVIRILLYRPKD